MKEPTKRIKKDVGKPMEKGFSIKWKWLMATKFWEGSNKVSLKSAQAIWLIRGPRWLEQV